jgi:hypothetical protein
MTALTVPLGTTATLTYQLPSNALQGLIVLKESRHILYVLFGLTTRKQAKIHKIAVKYAQLVICALKWELQIIPLLNVELLERIVSKVHSHRLLVLLELIATRLLPGRLMIVLFALKDSCVLEGLT